MTSKSKHSKQYKIGDYILKQTLGQGTFGKVKLGIHKQTNKRVAIKILDKSRIVEKGDQDRINKELKIINTFTHPNVIHVNELLQTHRYYFIIMEYCEGGELFHHIVKKRHLQEEETSFFFYQLINGLEYIHSHHIVHRDLKPENLLLTKDFRLKIIDFGLSNYFNKTLLSTPCGSPCYASPEMVSGNKYNGFKIDIWSCGIILYAMVCGYLPFEDKDNKRLFKKILECKVVFPHHLSLNVRDLISRILVTDPNRRITLEGIKAHSFYLKGKSFYEVTFGDVDNDGGNGNKDGDVGVDLKNACNGYNSNKHLPLSYKAFNTEGCLESYAINKEQQTIKLQREIKEKNTKKPELIYQNGIDNNNTNTNNNNEYHGLLTVNNHVSPAPIKNLQLIQTNTHHHNTYNHNSKNKPSDHIVNQTTTLKHKPLTYHPKPVSVTKPKKTIKITNLLDIQHSMRYPLYSSLITEAKSSSPYSIRKPRDTHNDTNAISNIKSPQSHIIKPASISINLIEPNSLISTSTSKQAKDLNGSSCTSDKDSHLLNLNVNLNTTKKIHITLDELFKRSDKKTMHTVNYADAVIKTQENNNSQMNKGSNSNHNNAATVAMSLSNNKKRISSLIEGYCPIRELKKSCNETTEIESQQQQQQQSRIKSLKLSDFYSPNRQVIGGNSNSNTNTKLQYNNNANVSYGYGNGNSNNNSITSSKKNKESDKSLSYLHNHFDYLFTKQYLTNNNNKKRTKR